MAQTGLRLKQEAFRAFGVILSVLLLMISNGSAFEFQVGGGNWTVPSDPNASVYNQWAEKHRFQIGDTILFTYNANHDSVLHVTKDDYTNCNTGAPIEKFTDGHTAYEFKKSGAYYFISGVSDNCHKNQKIVLVVMADRSNRNSTSSSPPSPAPEVPPPSPAPSGQQAPSPPPSGEESNPTPAPSGQSSPPKNGASGITTGVLGAAFATLFGASLVLV